MKLEFYQHNFSFEGDYSELIRILQNNINSNLSNCLIIEGVRFVGSNSLQRPIDECRVIDLDIHILLKSEKFTDYLLILENLKNSLKVSLPKNGLNLASISTVHGLYKPFPLKEGKRLLIHALIADRARYLKIDPTLRYSWKKYKSTIGSFSYVDSFSKLPSIQDVIYGKEGLLFYKDCIMSGRAKLGIIQEAKNHMAEEVFIESTEPSILHDLYTSSIVYIYRNFCRAFGILNEELGNFELVNFEKGPLEDFHHILIPAEIEALSICIKSKKRIRDGLLEELNYPVLENLRENALRFLKSVFKRFSNIIL